MDPGLLAKQAAVQRRHALQRARERYGLYFPGGLYGELLGAVRAGVAACEAGRRSSVVRVLGEQERGRVLVLRVRWLDEWMFVIYDRVTQEIRTFLPPRSQHIKGMDVSAA